ncbi:hypothetical protein H0264_18530 [Nocardia huaxiensis]|uniref:Uncharacterized protein n=1 Tax=Nocardia huaxiensis TaxID=2755382 RepID=A0A7D6VIZ6_9NOCA|nr:hypothetical protein [Nocardia huaxiensis]QLY33957.1 hypothetical protein H0264_18530 [Nocardia huaxiensis]
MHLIDPDNTPVTSQVMEVDSALARRWLERNPHNRPIRQARVQQYYEDMISGRWRLNGEAIKFGPDGELLDGQHRLQAVARTTGMRFPMLIVRGLAPDTQVTMDQGARRTPGDQLTLTGIASHNMTMVAAALRVYMVWMEGNLFGELGRGGGVSTTRVVEFASAYPELVAIADRYTGVAKRLKARPAVACAVAMRLTEIDAYAATEFVRLWDSGAGLAANSPILALRERLDWARVNKVRLSDRDQIGTIVTAWNLWRRGRTVTKLQRPKGGFTAENFPEPR